MIVEQDNIGPTSDLFDELTGIYNRKGFYMYTRKMLDEHKDINFYLVYWNVRNFKVVNNLFGWDTGDLILKQLANALREALGDEIATFGRVERDNFICCVQSKYIEQGEWKKLGDIIYDIEGSEYHFYSCCGLYPITDTSLNISEMGDKARVAMETIKNNYMTPYAIYDDSMWKVLVEEQNLNNDFKRAIKNKEFKVFYQPSCRTRDGDIIGAEALVRWEHKDRGFLSPGVFIPLFEKNGFINVLDNYVWEEVCIMLSKRIKKGLNVVPISINVSRVEFYNQNLCENIRDIADKYNVPPELIHIEITESAYSDNPELVQAAIEKLHKYGFMVFMDDFGSGYSSLNILKDLPIDVLKIDMKFLERFGTSDKTSIILESVIRMAKWMKLGVVAEGVETKKEWDYLRSVECDSMQGYYFYKPMPEDAYAALLDDMNIDKKHPWDNNDEEEYEDTINAAFNLSVSKESSLFYNMIGGMAIAEMKDDRIEIIQANKGYCEVVYGIDEAETDNIVMINRPIYEGGRKIILEKCILAKETGSIQQAQLLYKRKNGVNVWLGFKVRYIGSRGRRSLYYFAVDNIDEIKQAEQERYVRDYSEALLKIFDKVYKLDYDTGMAEVLHTRNNDSMKRMEKYYFKDFFSRFGSNIETNSEYDLSDVLNDKELLNNLIENSKNGSYKVSYVATLPGNIQKEVNALFFKADLNSGGEDIISCINVTTL